MRIAVWMHGGVGGGLFSQGQPNISALIGELAKRHHLDVYSQYPPNPDYRAKGFTIISAPHQWKRPFVRWVYLILVFLKNHIVNRYQTLYAFWGYPAGFIAVLLAKVFGLKSIVHLQGGDVTWIPELNYGVFSNNLNRTLAKWTYTSASELIALTRFQVHHLQKNKITREPHIIPYGTDTQRFFFSLKEHVLPIHCLHVANLSAVKDQATLLRCFKRLTTQLPATLRIIGEGDQKNELIRLGEELGVTDKIQLLGAVPHHAIAEHYHWAHVLLHTSYFEGQSLALTEAASTGVLIAGTNVGLLCDLGAPYGVIVPTGDHHLLAEQIIEHWRDTQRWQSKIIKARKWAEDHSFSCTVSRINGLILK
jgi:glycosyltransferase involved in cell wall biosynthesis